MCEAELTAVCLTFVRLPQTDARAQATVSLFKVGVHRGPRVLQLAQHIHASRGDAGLLVGTAVHLRAVGAAVPVVCGQDFVVGCYGRRQ